MDFATNADLLNELRDKLRDAITKISEEKENIFNDIERLGNSWEGESYTAFHEKCLSYEPAMESLITILEAYDKMLAKVETDSIQLVSDVASQLNA